MSHLPKPIEIPQGDWVERLAKGHWVWLVKEQQYARVVWVWEPPEPGHSSGRIAIDRYAEKEDGLYYIGEQTWFMRNNGAGLDGKQLFAPCEDNLLEFVPDVAEHLQQKVFRMLAKLDERVDRLERRRGF